MYSTPHIAVPKTNSDELRLVANQSAGQYCQNNMVDQTESKGARMDGLLVFIPLLLAFAQAHPGKQLLLWKSDVKGAFRLVPMHPFWQIKQVVTSFMPTMGEYKEGTWSRARWRRYVDWSACFGNRGSPRAWASIMGLVVWIAIFVANIAYLCCYVDDCYSVGLVGDMALYEPYNVLMPREQVLLLRIWDYLGIPHKAKKQVWGTTLTIIGFLVDPNAFTATLPKEGKDKLLEEVHIFVTSPSRRRTLREFQQLTGWVNWSLNVFPLFKPALCNVYAKVAGKTEPNMLIFINKAIEEDLAWFAQHVETSSGMLFFANFDWDPRMAADLTIFCDASLEGMGFWVPSLRKGFYSPVDQSSVMSEIIFYWEAVCVLAALEWFETSGHAAHGTPERPARLTIMTDNTNTVNIFDSLRVLPEYNPILKRSVDVRVRSCTDLRVLHVPGSQNDVADALSRSNWERLGALVGDIDISTFQPPRVVPGAAKK